MVLWRFHIGGWHGAAVEIGVGWQLLLGVEYEPHMSAVTLHILMFDLWICA